MRQSTQFSHILTAESEHLVNVTVQLPPDAKADFERKLTTAFTSEQYDENAQQWSAERLRIIQDTIEQHLVPTGAKWVREWLREEEEEFYCKQCASILRDVSVCGFFWEFGYLLLYSVWTSLPIVLKTCNPEKALLLSQCLGVKVIPRRMLSQSSTWTRLVVSENIPS